MTPTGTDQPTDPAGLVAFRTLFGLLMLVATVRFVANGWLDTVYRDPTFHFTWLYFDWVRPWPGLGLEVHFAAMGAAALSLALGYRPRLSAAVFGVLFTYAEFIEKAAYLNHYYLVSLIALALAIVPSTGPSVPRGAYLWLRIQIGVVYVHAGLAKLNSDWLFHAQPLRIWLQAYTDLPLAHVFAWGGALFDLTVVPLLIWRRTRALAYAAAVAFHVTIWALFPVGIFSPLMLLCATVFFEPSWPRRWVRLRPFEPSPHRAPRVIFAAASLFLLLQALLPLRGHRHPGDVNWHEDGFRFAWRVMLVEKVGMAEFRVCRESCERVFPSRELAPFQLKQMAYQPDMILQYAHHLGRDGAQVYADVWVSLNGRPSRRLVPPDLDLMTVDRGAPHTAWVLSGGPDTTPPSRESPPRAGSPP